MYIIATSIKRKFMKKSSIYLFFFFCSLIPLQGQMEQQRLPEATGIDNHRRTSFNLEEIKVRWKKSALENCPGAPCTTGPGTGGSFTCGSSISDIDGNNYNTVLIGTQCWTKENLKVTKYNNGTVIPDRTLSWLGAPAEGARTEYIGQTGYVATYGYLYNWYAAKGISVTGVIASTDTLNICPTGWHVPTYAEWNTLILFIDPAANFSNTIGNPSLTAGGKMKEISSLWNGPNVGADNLTGFSALPGGQRNGGFLANFNDINDLAYFINSSEISATVTRFIFLENTSSKLNRFNDNKQAGASVRCLKD
jgi:uncharacterized protein (TIGR02145 family)